MAYFKSPNYPIYHPGYVEYHTPCGVMPHTKHLVVGITPPRYLLPRNTGQVWQQCSYRSFVVNFKSCESTQTNSTRLTLTLAPILWGIGKGSCGTPQRACSVAVLCNHSNITPPFMTPPLEYAVSLGTELTKFKTTTKFYHGRTLHTSFSLPPVYTTPGSKFFGAPRAITGGVVYTLPHRVHRHVRVLL